MFSPQSPGRHQSVGTDQDLFSTTAPLQLVYDGSLVDAKHAGLASACYNRPTRQLIEDHKLVAPWTLVTTIRNTSGGRRCNREEQKHIKNTMQDYTVCMGLEMCF